MTEPRRLLEESESTLERAILGAGSSFPDTAMARTRTLTALGLVGSTVLSAGSASASLFEYFSWLKLLAISAIGAVAVPLGYFSLQSHEHGEASVASAPAAFGVELAPVLEGAAPVEAAWKAESSSKDSAPAQPPALAPGLDRTARTSPRDGASSVPLALELAALERARSALLTGSASEALSLLDAYGRSYPRGRLRLEAEVLRIDALFQSGQTGAAQKRAQVFLERHSKSVLASRVRGYL